MRRFHEAVVEGRDEVLIWGSGRPMREFLHVDDMAKGALFVMGLDAETYRANTQPMLSHVNLGTGEDISIADLARLIAEVIGFQGRIVFDTSKPDGAPRKLMDVGRLTLMGWRAEIALQEGITETYRWFTKHISDLREA